MNMTRGVFGICAALLLGGNSQAADIAYYANPDPTTVDGYPSLAGMQPWVLTLNPPGGPVGTNVIDGVTPAWQVNSPVSGHEEFWSITPTAAHVAQGNSLTGAGWTLTARFRLANVSDTLGPGSTVAYNGPRLFSMWFGTDADGDPMVRLFEFSGGPTYTLEGVGTNDYHTYSLNFDPVAGSADLFIDGIERISNWAGEGLGGAPFVAFGDGGGDTGNTLYDFVEWSAPEPSAMTLLAVGALLLARRRG